MKRFHYKNDWDLNLGRSGMKPEREQHHRWEWKRGQAREREKTDWQVHLTALPDKGQGVLSVPDRAPFMVIILSSSGIYKWSLFYSLYFSVLLYCLQWVCISFIIRENKDTSKLKLEIEQILDWRAFFSGIPGLLTPSSGTMPRLQVDPPWDRWHHSVHCPLQALEVCHTWAFLTSQDELFPFLTLWYPHLLLCYDSVKPSLSLPPSRFTSSQFFLPGPLKPLCHHTLNPLLLQPSKHSSMVLTEILLSEGRTLIFSCPMCQEAGKWFGHLPPSPLPPIGYNTFFLWCPKQLLPAQLQHLSECPSHLLISQSHGFLHSKSHLLLHLLPFSTSSISSPSRILLPSRTVPVLKSFIIAFDSLA